MDKYSKTFWKNNLKGFGILTCFVLFFGLVMSYFALLIYAVFPFILRGNIKNKKWDIYRDKQREDVKIDNLNKIKEANESDSMPGRMFLRYYIKKNYSLVSNNSFSYGRHLPLGSFHRWMIRNLYSCANWNEFETFIYNLKNAVTERISLLQEQENNVLYQNFINPLYTIQKHDGTNPQSSIEQQISNSHLKVSYLDEISKKASDFRTLSVEQICKQIDINLDSPSQIDMLTKDNKWMF